METTVYAELCRELAVFARDYKLITRFDPFDKDHPYEWGFTIYNASRSWGYRRLFSAFDHELINMDKREYAEMVVEDIRKELKRNGVI